MISKNW